MLVVGALDMVDVLRTSVHRFGSGWVSFGEYHANQMRVHTTFEFAIVVPRRT